MFKENYLNDPRKLINQPTYPSTGSGPGGFNREGGYRGGYQQSGSRGGYRRNEEGGENGGRQPNKKYFDYDDPQKYLQQQQNPDRQIVSYDDLF